MNALAHCVEAVVPNRTPEAEPSRWPGRPIYRCCRRCPTGPTIWRPAPGCSRAVLAGRSLHNAGMGVHHGLAQLLGGRTRLPHGLLNAVLLAHSVRFNEPAAPEAVGRLATALGVDPDAPGSAAEAIDALRASLGLPVGLGEAGVAEEDIEAVARLSQSSVNPCGPTPARWERPTPWPSSGRPGEASPASGDPSDAVASSPMAVLVLLVLLVLFVGLVLAVFLPRRPHWWRHHTLPLRRALRPGHSRW